MRGAGERGVRGETREGRDRPTSGDRPGVVADQTPAHQLAVAGIAERQEARVAEMKRGRGGALANDPIEPPPRDRQPLSREARVGWNRGGLLERPKPFAGAVELSAL